MFNLSASLSRDHLLDVFRPEADNVLSWNLVHAKLISVTAEAVTNSAAVVTEEVASCLVLTAEPELLVTLKQRVVIKELSIQHREASSIDIDLPEKLGSVLHCLSGAKGVSLWMNNDGVSERISLNTVGSAGNRDNLSAVFTNDLVFNFRGFVQHRRHLIDELTVGEHELVDQNEIAALNRDSLSLIAALRALSRVSSCMSISTTTSAATSAAATV